MLKNEFATIGQNLHFDHLLADGQIVCNYDAFVSGCERSGTSDPLCFIGSNFGRRTVYMMAVIVNVRIFLFELAFKFDCFSILYA